jgi:hypothetical protein
MTRHALADPAHEAAFRRDGYVVLDLLTDGDVQTLWEVYRSCGSSHDDGFTPTVLLDDLELRARIHREVSAVVEPRILPVLDDYRMAVGSFAVKQAGNEYSQVGLHQDLTFVDESKDDQAGISVWAPLMPVDAENGNLGVAVGTHRLNSYWREPCSLPYRDLVDLIEDEFMTYLPMQPGQVLLMDNRLFHASPANHSEQTRVVAAGIAVPRESQLVYCHRDLEGDDSVLEIWQVPEDFYVRHGIGRRPAEGRRAAVVPAGCDELTEDALRRHFATAA